MRFCVGICTNSLDLLSVLSRIDAAPLENSRFLVSWQTPELRSPFSWKGVRVIPSQTVGLSRNRNNLLASVETEYVLISDDDLVYLPETVAVIEAALDSLSHSDLLIFRVRTENGSLYKKYPEGVSSVTRWGALKVSSVEMLVRISSVRERGIQFDERFGLGAKYPIGEEAIFVSDSLQSGLGVLRVPEVIVEHPAVSSSSSFAPNMMKARGAFFVRMFGPIGILVAYVFTLKNLREVLRSNGFLSSFGSVGRGCVEILTDPR